jgi:hypothetical protein
LGARAELTDLPNFRRFSLHLGLARLGDVLRKWLGREAGFTDPYSISGD